MTKPIWIEIRGTQFVNKGAYLMLVACIEQLKRYNPDIEIVLAPNKNSPYKCRSLLGAYQKVSLRFRGLDFNVLSYFIPKFVRKMLRERFGLVLEPELELVLDASGFAYGDQWGGRNVKLLAAEILRLSRQNVGYVLLPQAFGPFKKTSDQRALAKGLSAALLVCARDPQSYQYLREHSVGANIQQFADFTNLVNAQLPAGEIQSDIAYGLVIPNSAMLSHRNHNSSWQSVYLRQLQCGIRLMREAGLTPILLNHEGQADANLCQQLIVENPNLRVLNPTTPVEVKGWIAGARIVICSRFHGCVSALSSGVPCIGTSWSHKYEMLFAEYGQNALIQPDTSEDELRCLIAQVGSAENRQLLQERAEYWKQQSHQMWQTVFQRIDSAIDSGQVQIKQA